MLPFASCEFSQDEAVQLLGGKAANLVFLRRECSGVRVPDGFVVPTTFLDRFLSFCPEVGEPSIGEQIETRLAELNGLSPTDSDLLSVVRRCGESIRSLIHGHERIAFDMLLQEGLDSSLATLKVGNPTSRYAVRSSGVAEDLSEFSFAGQMETVLNVPGDSSCIIRAIITTWMSLFSDRALSYRHLYWKPGPEKRMEKEEEKEEEEGEVEIEYVDENGEIIDLADEDGEEGVDFVVVDDDGANVVVGPKSAYSFPLLCVIVQRMVPNVVVAGVAYTADPLTSSRSSIVVSAVFGLGESLAEGKTAPDTFWIRKRDGNLTDVKLGQKRTKIVPRRKTGDDDDEEEVFVEEVEVEGMEEKRALTDDDIDEVVRVALQIEEAYGGFPQDIEFAIEEGGDSSRILWIVQARPMTSLSGCPTFPRLFYETDGEYNARVSVLDGKRVFMNLNYYEVLSHPLDPFSLSFIRDAFLTPCGHWLFRDVPEVRDSWQDRSVLMEGHLFVDLTDLLNSAWAAARMFLLLEFAIDPLAGKGLALLRQRGFFDTDDVPTSPLRPAELWAGAFISPMIWFQRIFSIDVEAQQQQMDEVIASVVPESEEAFRRIDKEDTPANLVLEHIRVLREEFERLFGTIIPNLIVGAGCAICLQQMGLPEDDIGTLDNGLLFSSRRLELGMKKVASVARESGVLDDIEAILNSDDRDGDFSIPSVIEAMRARCGDDESSAFVTALADFSEKWGFRGLSEMAPTSPRFAEDCSYVLHFCLRSSPDEPSPDQAEIEAAVTEHMLTRFWETRPCCSNTYCFGLVNCLLARAVGGCCRVYRALFKYREECKHNSMQVAFRCRQKIFEIIEESLVPHILVQAEDSHFLYLEEILWCMDHLEAFEEDPELKDHLHQTISSRRRELKEFEDRNVPHLVTSDCERVDVLVHQEFAKDLPENVLAGIAASPGIATGRVKLLLDPHVDWVEKGEIVVANQIDPAMSVLFSEASGLVSEVGGLQTHGVTVAREVGIPAVVCVMDVCSKLKNGQLIRVNGSMGTVEILEEDENGEEVELEEL